MILADKIIEERKSNGWSQEQLAEQLDVSRQSVSKWEGAQSVPDLNRIIQMAEIFGVSTDYLLREDQEKTSLVSDDTNKAFDGKPFRKVSMEEAQDLMTTTMIESGKIAKGAFLCIIACVPLVVLGGLADSHKMGVTEKLAGSIGIVSLLSFIGFGVYFLINSSFILKRFEFLEKYNIETEYGVDGLANKNKVQFEPSYHRNITLGVMLCIFSVIPLIAVSTLTEESYILTIMIGIMLIVIGFAVTVFIRSQMRMDAYNKLLQEGDFTMSKKEASPLISRISGIYWISTTAIYLAWSFATNNWQETWIVWPIAGLLFAVVMIITKMITKVED